MTVNDGAMLTIDPKRTLQTGKQGVLGGSESATWGARFWVSRAAVCRAAEYP
jgi:hypothetical protein